MSGFGDFKNKEIKAFEENDLEQHALRFSEVLLGDVESVLNATESPIEAALAIGMFNAVHSAGEIDWCLNSRQAYFAKGLHPRLQIAPQYQIESYRVDFAIYQLHHYGRVTRMIIECDGHDFHERTKAQAARDRKRDRDLLMLGWKVLRFTGSEIHKDRDACAQNIFEFIEGDTIDDWRSYHG